MVGQIAIADIEIDESLYPRVGGVEWRTIEAYKQAMETGAKFPPIVVAPIDGKIALIDGRHRLEATKKLKKKTILAETLKKMSPDEAFVEALKRNIINGRQLSFYDRMSAYLVLKGQGRTIGDISNIIQIPQRKVLRYVSNHIIESDGVETVIKGTLKHLKDQRKIIRNIDDQSHLHGISQEDLINQLIIIVANGWLDSENKSVVYGITKQKELVKVT